MEWLPLLWSFDRFKPGTFRTAPTNLSGQPERNFELLKGAPSDVIHAFLLPEPRSYRTEGPPIGLDHGSSGAGKTFGRVFSLDGAAVVFPPGDRVFLLPFGLGLHREQGLGE